MPTKSQLGTNLLIAYETLVYGPILVCLLVGGKGKKHLSTLYNADSFLFDFLAYHFPGKCRVFFIPLLT
jgi:hypothetical protein